MRILILGGTRFFGSFLTERALERGHEVTVLHRGPSQVAALAGAQQLHADRRDRHVLLANRNFDAVVDTSGRTANATTERRRARHACMASQRTA